MAPAVLVLMVVNPSRDQSLLLELLVAFASIIILTALIIKAWESPEQQYLSLLSQHCRPNGRAAPLCVAGQ